MKCLSVLILMLLAGCSTQTTSQPHDVEAKLDAPQPQSNKEKEGLDAPQGSVKNLGITKKKSSAMV